MNAEDVILFLAEAEACFRDGDYEGAREYLEQIDDIDRIEPAVIDLELRLIPKTGGWEKARGFSNLLGFAFDEQHKITVAEFRVEWAAFWLEKRRTSLAVEQLQQAFKLWPPIRLQVIDDSRFEGVLEGRK